MPPFTFKRSRPQAQDHSDALLVEFAGFWMDTENEVFDSSTQIGITPVVIVMDPCPPSEDQVMGRTVSVISIEDDEDSVQEVPPQAAEKKPAAETRPTSFLTTCKDIDSFMTTALDTTG